MNDDLNQSFENSFEEIKASLEQLGQRLNNIINGVGAIMVITILIVSYRLARKIGGDLQNFSSALRSYTESDFKSQGLFKDLSSDTQEIQDLLHDFRKMDEKLRRTMLDLKRSVRQAEHNAKVKSYFLANMSHEIRTPLNGVLGMIHLLKDTHDPKKRQEFLNIIEFSARHLGDLVNMILDFSKIDAGKMELHYQPTDLEDLLKSLLKMFRFKAEENDNELLLDMDFQLDHLVSSDSLRLKQVLINLLSNALKFTQGGKVELIIRREKQAQKNKVRLSFAVQDNGIGIEESKIKSLFKAYSQTDRSIQKRYGGTGLGLAITYELVRLMGGDLMVQSKLHEGTRFYFHLDFTLGPLKSEGGHTAISKVPGLSQKVLVVEDNPVNQKVLLMLLKRYGLAVNTAENGQQAVEAFERHHYGLILMDLQMPVMDGLTATLKITQSQFSQKN